MPYKVFPDRWYNLRSEISDQILCGECALTDLERTRQEIYKDNERVTIDMLHELTDWLVEPYQCDGCLKQNEAYEELGYE